MEISPGCGMLPPPTMPASAGLSTCVEIDFSFSGDAMQENPGKHVDSEYVATRLGCTATLVRRMARLGTIPAECVYKMAGKGQPWEFDRERIDKWIEMRLEAKRRPQP